MSPAANGVLSGVRVLDFGRFIAGPYCGALLADLGAEVTRIERVGGGEDREFVPVTPEGVGASFLQCNRGKRGLTLDTSKVESRDIVARLVRGADVVLTNLPGRTLQAMGLSYPLLKAMRPDVIAVNISAFGSGGDWSDRVGFDGLMQAMSGTAFLAGRPGEPTRTFAAYVDFSTATVAALSTLAALMHRAKTGEGQAVEASLFRTAIGWNSNALIEEAMLEAGRISTHNRGQTAGPSDIFPTRDGWVMCLVVGRYQFGKWARMVGLPGLVDDPRFADDTARGENGAELSAIMGRWCAERTAQACIAEMEGAGVPGGPVLSPREVLDTPHLRQTGIFQPVDYPGAARPVPLATFPATLSATPASIRARAPTVGEHTDEILREAGYGNGEIEAFRAAGVV